MTLLKPFPHRSRLRIVTPWLLLTAFVGMAAVPSFRALLLDAANKPTADVSLSSTHWTGTLDPARLPAAVPLLDASHNLNVDGLLHGGAGVASQQFYAPGGSVSIDLSNPATGVLRDGGTDVLEWNAAGIRVPSTINGESLHAEGSVTIYSQLTVYGDTSSYGNRYEYGGLYSQGGIIASGGIYDGNGNTTLDPTGVVYASRGLGVWGATPPASQPPTPTTLAEAISLLRAYGFCQ